jgi:hypothetical protein
VVVVDLLINAAILAFIICVAFACVYPYDTLTLWGVTIMFNSGVRCVGGWTIGGKPNVKPEPLPPLPDPEQFGVQPREPVPWEQQSDAEKRRRYTNAAFHHAAFQAYLEDGGKPEDW